MQKATLKHREQQTIAVSRCVFSYCDNQLVLSMENN